MQANESARTSKWIPYRRWIQITALATVAAWLAFWDSNAGTAFVSKMSLRLIWLDPFLAKVFLFWVPPIAGIAAIQLLCYSLDRALLMRRWTALDLLRLTFWRTVSPTLAILFLATGFTAISDGRFMGVSWLVIAAVVATVGKLGLRSAEGMKLQQVKGGELYKRAFALAKVTKTPLHRVYVVPAGRGHLTNAYGATHMIAVTDNYGKFLTSAQLDFVIGHELGHAKGKHAQKQLLITAGGDRSYGSFVFQHVYFPVSISAVSRRFGRVCAHSYVLFFVTAF